VKRTDLLKRLRQIAKDQGASYDLTDGGSHTKV